MDDPHTPPHTSRSRSISPPHLSPSARTAAHTPSDEHSRDSSPRRKKPRLDHGKPVATKPASMPAADAGPVNEAAAAVSQEPQQSSEPDREVTPSASQPDLPRALSPLASPSRITLHLRNQADAGVPLAADTVAIQPTDAVKSEAEDRQVTNTIDLGSIHSTGRSDGSSSTAHSPVIEIDAPEDPGDSDLIIGSDDVTVEEQCLTSFPYVTNNGPASATLVLLDSLPGLNLSSVFLNLGRWLRTWNSHIAQGTINPEDAYRNSDFWYNMGVVVTKLINRKSAFGSWDPNATPDQQVVHDFFCEYAVVCSDMLEVDFKSTIKDCLEHGAELQVECAAHIRSLDRLLKSEGGLWFVLEAKYGLRTAEMARSIAAFVALRQPTFVTVLIELASLLDQTLIKRPSLAGLFAQVLSILGNLASAFQPLRHEPTNHMAMSRSEDLHPFASRMLPFAQQLSDDWAIQIPRQPSNLPVDVSKILSQSVGEILGVAAVMDADAASVAFDKEYPGESDVDVSHRPLLIQCSTLFRLFWSFISKGRMELRVLGIESLVSKLVEVHNGNCNVEGGLDLLRAIGHRLANYRPVQYLISVESHPQLIQRCSDLAGFLLITKTWDDEMTEALWKALTTMQDPHFTSAILDMCSKSRRNFGSKELLAICRRIRHLSLQQYNDKMADFLSQIFNEDKLDLTDDIDEKLEPYRAVAQLLRTCYGPKTSNEEYNKAQNLELTANHCLALLYNRRRDFEERSALYLECAADARDMSVTAWESLDIIRALLISSHMTDLFELLKEVNLLELVAENVCVYVSDQHQTSVEHQDWSQLGKRMRLFSMLMFLLPAAALAEDLESRLWNHLFGGECLSIAAREDTWIILALDLANHLSTRGGPVALLNRFLDNYLPSFGPDAFTEGSLRFFEGAIRYKMDQTPVQKAQAEGVISVPLIEMLWYIIFNVPSKQVCNTTILMICRHYLDFPYIRHAHSLALAATHTALVDRCVSQLELSAADMIVLQSDQPSSATVTLEVAKMRFHRALEFLRVFLEQVRLRNLPRTASPKVPSPAPGSPSSEIVGELCEFNFQMFSYGTSKGSRLLKVGSDATLQDFQTRVKRLTGWTDLVIIIGGQKIDCTLDKVVKGLPAGNMLVQNKASITSARAGVHFAEEAVNRHIEELYAFLDLELDLAESVSRFMLASCPSYTGVKDLVLQGSAINDLFPLAKVPKATYNVNCMNYHLRQQIRVGAIEDDYLYAGIKVLTQAVVRVSETRPLCRDSQYDGFTVALMGSIQSFLKARSYEESRAPYIDDDASFVKAMIDGFHQAKERRLYGLTWHIFACLQEACLHSRGVWESFSTSLDVDSIKWLLLEAPEYTVRDQTRLLIDSLCTSLPSQAATTRADLIAYWWQKLVEIIPDTLSLELQSSETFSLASNLLPLTRSSREEETVTQYLRQWGALLLKHKLSTKTNSRDVHPLFFGLARLLTRVVQTLKSFKKPIIELELMRGVLEEFLFPPLTVELGSSDDQSGRVPILESGTRRELYNLVMSLCQSTEAHQLVMDQMFGILTRQESAPLLSDSDRSKMLRSQIGYVGLRNLTNTCYMNSLLSQLYMTPSFRNFILRAPITDSEGSQRLLHELKILFNYMLASEHKYADTYGFALAIKPYEGTQIDVAVQMDVDEFYNLLFDRLESQLLSITAKKTFRSIFGGELVTQIRSFDCHHVSERSEHYFAIQCDIKGKANLHESLKAYTEGDMMQGDNRYKCESCGGKFVEAVRRTCLKDIPDNVIFHLKRFDFDLTTMQRSKINDYFQFPERIDLTPYKLEFLNDPQGQHEQDMFRLTGILIHNGTAETGHYYSFVRESSAMSASSDSWIEFNDIEVSEFDASKLGDHAFGGRYVNTDGTSGWVKHHNAYMLFYERMKTDFGEPPVNGADMAMGDAPQDNDQFIQEDNEILLRRYCLMDPVHAQFMRSQFTNFKNLEGGSCSEKHEAEASMLSLMMQHLDQIFTRVKDCPDLELTTELLKTKISTCQRCVNHVLDWLTVNTSATLQMLLASPVARVRQEYCKLVIFLLESLSHFDVTGYGVIFEQTIEGRELHVDRLGSLPAYVDVLRALIPRMGRYARFWNEFFVLLRSIAELGPAELLLLLQERFLEDALELLLIEPQVQIRRSSRLREVANALGKEKRHWSCASLVDLVEVFLRNIDPYASAVSYIDDRITEFDAEKQTYPLTRSEQEMILLYDPNTKQIPFLMRCIDQADSQPLQDWSTSAIVQRLLTLDPPVAQDARMSQTFVAAIEEYIPAFIRPALYTAATFCQYSAVETHVQNIIRATAKNAEQLESTGGKKKVAFGNGTFADPDAEGGHATIEFFSIVARLPEVACIVKISDEDGPVDPPLMRHVLRCTPMWAPALLYFDDKTVRASAYQLLGSLVFSQFPRLPSDDLRDDVEGVHRDSVHYKAGETSTESALMLPSDSLRTEMMPTLFARCRHQFSAAWESKIPKAYVVPLLDTMGACAQWTRYLKDSGSTHHQELYEKIAGQELDKKWQHIAQMFRNWPEYENEEAFSGTEYASNGEDESDEMQSDT